MPKHTAFTYRAADDYSKTALEMRERLRKKQDLALWHPTHKASYDPMNIRSRPVGKSQDATIRNGKVVDSKARRNESDEAFTARCLLTLFSRTLSFPVMDRAHLAGRCR